MPMTIAFDVSYIQERRTGYGRASLELLRSLLSLDQENHYALHGWSYSLDNAEITKLAQRNVKISLTRIPGFVRRFYWNTLRTPSIEVFVKDFDLFHSPDPLLPPAGRKRTIATLHDLSYKKFPQFFERHVLRWDKSVARSVKSASAVIVPSEHTKSDLLEFFKIPEERVEVVYFPVSSMFHPGSDAKSDEAVGKKHGLQSPFALFVGTIEPRKNLTRLVKAFEMLHREKKSELRLVLVGKRGWLCDRIFETLAVSGVRERIQYLEYVADEELASIYRLAQFLVYPSMYEGYGFPVLEAMASGIPVITSNTSSLKEIGLGAAFLADPMNIEELAQAMQRMAETASLRMELSQRGIEQVKKFSSQTAAAKVLRLYHSLVP